MHFHKRIYVFSPPTYFCFSFSLSIFDLHSLTHSAFLCFYIPLYDSFVFQQDHYTQHLQGTLLHLITPRTSLLLPFISPPSFCVCVTMETVCSCRKPKPDVVPTKGKMLCRSIDQRELRFYRSRVTEEIWILRTVLCL